MNSERVREQLEALPARPGVYLLRDEVGRVLYVGKAARLRHRVRSYFTPSHTLPAKTQRMVRRVVDIDFLVTASEQEAVLLECNLIKEHRPRYNVRLKDDKNYPYLKVTLNEEWPRVYITRRVEQDGARYFGPFASAGSVRQTLNVVRKIFPFRSCRKPITGTDSRPCLEYHIHRCLGPCIGAVGRGEYHEMIEQLILFLEGKQRLVIRQLRRRMLEAARELQFERAALLRRQIEAVESITESQKITSPGGREHDVIAVVADGDQAYVEVFFIRGGKLTGRDHFLLDGTQDEESGEIVASFIKQFYGSSPHIPPQIVLPSQPSDASLLEQWLEGRRGGRVKLAVARWGKRKQLVEMAEENARLGLEQWRIKRLAESGARAAALEQLREQLHLPGLPQRIECYDISDIGGTSAVGSMVVFEGGEPRKEYYRRFRIKTVSGADDYAMMAEVLRRRFGRSGFAGTPGGTGASQKSGGKGWAIVPDLVVIDGGKGHLGAALGVMEEMNVSSVPVIALAKEKEEIFIPGKDESLVLPPNSSALYLLQRVRDEAHRFALSYHVVVRRGAALTSRLDEVPGIGRKRKRALLKRFGSVKGIREASEEELMTVEGMTRKAAQGIKEHL